MPLHDRPKRRDVPRWAVFAAALTIAGYAALLWTLDALPFQDLPNHLTRTAIERDILFHGGKRFGAEFVFEPQLMPYIGGDALLAGLIAAFGDNVGSRLWLILVAAAFPLAFSVYLRAAGYSRYSIFVAVLLSLYLATDWFFLTGMHHYRLALALTLLALAAWERWLRSATMAAYLAWTLVLAIGYLVHLSALLFSALGAAVIALVACALRQTSWHRALAGAVPVVALCAWHSTFPSNPADGAVVWRGVISKIVEIRAPFYRYGGWVDAPLLLGLGFAAILLLAGKLRLDRRTATAALLTLAFLALYVALPFSSGRSSFLDNRTLPLAATFALVTALAGAETGARRGRLVIWAALALAVANLAVLSAHLLRHNRMLRDYRSIAAHVPAAARVLPVATQPMDGMTNPYLHAGAFAVLDAGAYVPYLFSGGVTPYFRYRTPPVRPVGTFWYQTAQAPDPEARAAMEADFQYILLMNPFDPARLPVATELVARNDSASLLRIVPE
jgi:hypothetical protein